MTLFLGIVPTRKPVLWFLWSKKSRKCLLEALRVGKQNTKKGPQKHLKVHVHGFPRFSEQAIFGDCDTYPAAPEPPQSSPSSPQAKKPLGWYKKTLKVICVFCSKAEVWRGFTMNVLMETRLYHYVKTPLWGVILQNPLKKNGPSSQNKACVLFLYLYPRAKDKKQEIHPTSKHLSPGFFPPVFHPVPFNLSTGFMLPGTDLTVDDLTGWSRRLFSMLQKSGVHHLRFVVFSHYWKNSKRRQ